MQVFNLRKSFALLCVGHPAFLKLHRGTESHHRDLSPATHLPQQSTNQRWCGDQRTLANDLANDTPRTGRRGKICPKLQILTWKRACGLPKLFKGHTVHLSRTKRTTTKATDKSQLLRGECV